MSLKKIPLRKLLRIFYASSSKQVSLLREDIRRDRDKDFGDDEGGGDFFVPFWADAKKHVAGQVDLINQTKLRIEKNPRRAGLYPKLQDGFLGWWNEKRRWKNEPFEQIVDSIKGQHSFPSLGAIVKVENTLALKVAGRSERIVYPYFSREPILPDEGARLGLWLLSQALKPHSEDSLRILDVLRSASFSLLDVPLQGNEQTIFGEKYAAVFALWEKLKTEYE